MSSNFVIDHPPVPSTSYVRPAELRTDSPRHVLLGLCLAFVATRLPFLFTVPMVEAPDEFAHYWVIKFIDQTMRLPTAAEVAAGGPSAVYGSLPQIGYIPHVLLTAWLPESEIALVARFGSMLMGLLTVYGAYLLGRELFTAGNLKTDINRLAALALPLMVILHPQLCFLHSYANSDSTAVALSTFLLLAAVRAVRYGLSVRNGLIIGVCTGLLALCKYSALSVMPSVALCMVAALWLHQTGIARSLLTLVLSASAAIVVSAWWFVRNYYEFSGDILGTQTMYKSWAQTFNRDLNFYMSPLAVMKEFRWWRMTFFSYWGMFGYMTKYLWRPVYIAWGVYAAIAAIGWLRSGALERFKPGSKVTLVIWGSMALCLVTNLALMIMASTRNLGGPQGRYLFPSEVAIMALLIAGMTKLGPRFAKPTLLSFLVFNGVVLLGSWLMLFFSYGWHLKPL
jgi:4-amino-4-deoxy-L-arabinose transferase-like glycosyltransferase